MKYLLQNSMTEYAKGKCAALFSLVLMVINISVIWAKDCDECYARPIEIQTAEASLMKDIYSGRKNINTFNLKKARKNDAYWKVYSDRADNKVYESYNGRFEKGQLQFMEAVLVTKVSDDGAYIRVSREEIIDGKYAYSEVGWVKTSTLVLTDKALSNSNGISKKGLVLVNLDNVQELKIMIKEAQIRGYVEEYVFYDRPDIRRKGKPRRKAQKLDVRFVIKELPNLKLLSVNDELSNLTPVQLKSYVDGWMNSVNITDWDTRICLETTHGAEYKEEYDNMDIPVFINKKQLRAFQNTGISAESAGPIYRFKIRKNRLQTNRMRLPILEYDDIDDIVKVATLGSVKGNGDENEANIKRLLSDLKRKRNNINILFVIDATSSMNQYYPAVQRGISNIVALNKNIYKDKTIKFAVSIYRDYEDASNEYVVEPLTDDPDRIFRFLAKVETRSVAKSVHESVYNGILKGLEESGMNSEESNVVILIGDAGNHRQDKRGYSKEKVSERLSAYKANFIAFQVYKSRDKAYRHFNRDAMDLVLGTGTFSSTKQYLEPNCVLSTSRRNTYDLVFKDPKNDIEQEFPGGGFARFTYAENDSPMPISVLKQNLGESLRFYFDAIDGQMIRYQDLVNNGSVITGDSLFHQAERMNVFDYLKDNGMTEEEIELGMESLSKFSLTGYTKSKFYNSSLECFAPVVYMTDNEVQNVIATFRNVDPKANNADARTQIYEALLATVKAYTGEQTDENIKKKTFAEIWEIILNIPFDEANRYGVMRDMRLEDFDNSKNVRLKRKFILEFQQSLGQFTKTNLRDDQFELNGQYFYWIPLNKIPGNGG